MASCASVQLARRVFFDAPCDFTAGTRSIPATFRRRSTRSSVSFPVPPTSTTGSEDPPRRADNPTTAQRATPIDSMPRQPKSLICEAMFDMQFVPRNAQIRCKRVSKPGHTSGLSLQDVHLAKRPAAIWLRLLAFRTASPADVSWPRLLHFRECNQTRRPSCA